MDKQVTQGTNKQEVEPTPDQLRDKLPASGVAENPNPRANENIKDRETQGNNNPGVGSEITDGEDA